MFFELTELQQLHKKLKKASGKAYEDIEREFWAGASDDDLDGMSPDEIREMLASIDRIAIAGGSWKESTDDFVVLIRLHDAAQAPLWLRTWQADPSLALPTGTAYRRDDETELGAWFESQRILAIGPADNLERVAATIAGETPSLASADIHQQAARRMGDDAVLRAMFVPQSDLFDSADFGDPERARRFGAALTADPQASTVSGSITDAGFRSALHMELPIGELLELPPFPRPEPPRLIESLPTSTGIYLSLTLPQIPPDLIEAAQNELPPNLEQELGVSPAVLLDALGDQIVAAVLLSGAMSSGSSPKDTPYGMVLIAELDDPKPFRKLVANLIDQHYGPMERAVVTLNRDGNRWTFSSATKRIPLNGVLEIGDRHLLLVNGKQPLVDQALAAFHERSGLTRTAPHKRAFAALPPEANAYFWMDTGRVILAASDHLDDNTAKVLSLFPALGDDRPTNAAALRVAHDGRQLSLDLISLNGLLEGIIAAASIWAATDASAVEEELSDPAAIIIP